MGSSLTQGGWFIDGTLNITSGANIETITSSTIVELEGPSASFGKVETVRNVQGTLRIKGNSFLGVASGTVVVTGVLEVDGGSYSQSVQPFLDQNAGFIRLKNGGTISAAVTVNSGVVEGRGTFMGAVFQNVGGTIRPGTSPGVLNITGNYVQNATGTLDIEVGGTNPSAPDFDQLLIGGSAALAGTLNVSLTNGFVPDKSESFRFMTFASRLGDFSTANLPWLPEGAF